MEIKIKRVLLTVIFAIVFFLIIYVFAGTFFKSIGGTNYLYIPFPVKVISCGTSLDPFSDCTYPLVWWGIAASLIFWLVAILLFYKLSKKIFG